MRFGVLVLFVAGCGFETRVPPSEQLTGEDAPRAPDAALFDDAAVVMPDTPPPKVCGAAYVAVTGLASKYRRVQVATPWPVAKADCESDGGYLVIPKTVAEAKAVGTFIDPLDSDPYYWAGISDPELDGTWTTVTNQAYTTIAWAVGDPDRRPNEIYMLVKTDGTFYDWFADRSQEYACECTP